MPNNKPPTHSNSEVEPITDDELMDLLDKGFPDDEEDFDDSDDDWYKHLPKIKRPKS